MMFSLENNHRWHKLTQILFLFSVIISEICGSIFIVRGVLVHMGDSYENRPRMTRMGRIPTDQFREVSVSIRRLRVHPCAIHFHSSWCANAHG